MSRGRSVRNRLSRSVVFTAVLLTALAVPAVAYADPAHPGHGRDGVLAPSGLRVDGQASDVLIGGQARPTLSWIVNDSGRAEAQSAYEIRVESLPAHTSSRHSAVWDSGRVRSSDSVDVVYAGPALASNHTYQWAVRTWNSEGRRSPWSRAWAPHVQVDDVGYLDDARIQNIGATRDMEQAGTRRLSGPTSGVPRRLAVGPKPRCPDAAISAHVLSVSHCRGMNDGRNH